MFPMASMPKNHGKPPTPSGTIVAVRPEEEQGCHIHVLIRKESDLGCKPPPPCTFNNPKAGETAKHGWHINLNTLWCAFSWTVCSGCSSTSWISLSTYNHLPLHSHSSGNSCWTYDSCMKELILDAKPHGQFIAAWGLCLLKLPYRPHVDIQRHFFSCVTSISACNNTASGSH